MRRNPPLELVIEYGLSPNTFNDASAASRYGPYTCGALASVKSGSLSPLDQFIPHPDVAERFAIRIKAPLLLCSMWGFSSNISKNFASAIPYRWLASISTSRLMQR
jgi:hypothetical protein